MGHHARKATMQMNIEKLEHTIRGAIPIKWYEWVPIIFVFSFAEGEHLE